MARQSRLRPTYKIQFERDGSVDCPPECAYANEFREAFRPERDFPRVHRLSGEFGGQFLGFGVTKRFQVLVVVVH